MKVKSIFLALLCVSAVSSAQSASIVCANGAGVSVSGTSVSGLQINSVIGSGNTLTFQGHVGSVFSTGSITMTNMTFSGSWGALDSTTLALQVFNAGSTNLVSLATQFFLIGSNGLSGTITVQGPAKLTSGASIGGGVTSIGPNANGPGFSVNNLSFTFACRTSYGGSANSDVFYGSIKTPYTPPNTGSYTANAPFWDLMLGGLGDDTYYVDHAMDQPAEDANAGNDTVLFVGNWPSARHVDSYLSIENIANGDNTYPKTLYGDANANIIGHVPAAQGAPTWGQGVNDVMYGGAGDDIYVVNDLGDVVHENANEGTDFVDVYCAAYSIETMANVENLAVDTFFNGSVQLTGNASGNLINGWNGNDTLDGKGGDDTLTGGGGNDVLTGGAGTDTAVFSGAQSAYTITRIANVPGVQLTVAGPDGTDTLSEIERLQFSDAIAPVVDTPTGTLDGWQYLASNPQLIGAGLNSAAAGISHYLDYGIAEGRSLTAFDPYEYLASNPSLIATYRLNPAGATQYYVITGYALGHATSSFDAYLYLASNPDLPAALVAQGANLDIDARAGAKHYVEWGYNEGRPTTTFDTLRYVASNPGLIGVYGMDTVGATAHYVRYGIAEGRPTVSFDGWVYLASNTQLIDVGLNTLQQAYSHYIQWGFSEGRPTTGFLPFTYVASNPSLIPYYPNGAGAAEHYVRWGRAEGRSLATFSGIRYVAGNGAYFRAQSGAANLFHAGVTLEDGAQHYVQVGATAGMNTMFDSELYATNNPDLGAYYANHPDRLNALAYHYVAWGYGEGRPYP